MWLDIVEKYVQYCKPCFMDYSYLIILLGIQFRVSINWFRNCIRFKTQKEKKVKGVTG